MPVCYLLTRDIIAQIRRANHQTHTTTLFFYFPYKSYKNAYWILGTSTKNKRENLALFTYFMRLQKIYYVFANKKVQRIHKSSSFAKL